MYTTLDGLLHEQQIYKYHTHTPNTNKAKLRKEFKILTIAMLVCIVAVFVFTNINLISAVLAGDIKPIEGFHAATEQGIAATVEQNTQTLQEIQAIIQEHQTDTNITMPLDIKQVLDNQLSSYTIDFNVLPPVSRLIVPDIGLDAPLITMPSKTDGDFIRGDFDTELQQGVVKYPTTPAPGNGGNTLIFGHTSQERRQHNPYGTIFVNLPKLQAGSEIQLVRDGVLYKYKVIHTVIHRPKDVDDEFQKRQNAEGEYITLMGCYPLGTTKQRMMVIAQRVE